MKDGENANAEAAVEGEGDKPLNEGNADTEVP